MIPEKKKWVKQEIRYKSCEEVVSYNALFDIEKGIIEGKMACFDM